MHSRSPFPWNSIPTTQNILSTPWTFVHWKSLASVSEPPVHHFMNFTLICVRVKPPNCSLRSWAVALCGSLLVSLMCWI
uniref:Uncharacterized protein n=1 Tax=Urocitellus parryii TaxID=9999 RepID=A0A8D2GYK0_UROPR